ncbi:hypothetical protein Vretifemale_13178, partial [Volvox reticuliferus]
ITGPARGPTFCYDVPAQSSAAAAGGTTLWSKPPCPDPRSKSPFRHPTWNSNAVVLRPGSALLRAGASSPTRSPSPSPSPVPWLGTSPSPSPSPVPWLGTSPE